MNFSAIAISSRTSCCPSGPLKTGSLSMPFYEAIVFAWLALEALLNEQAYVDRTRGAWGVARSLVDWV